MFSTLLLFGMSGFSVADKTLGQNCAHSVSRADGSFTLMFAPVILSAAERLSIKTSRALPAASISVARLRPMATPDFGVCTCTYPYPVLGRQGSGCAGSLQ